MKKILNGKIYNTETAKYIGDWTTSYPTNDINFWGESLYLKKNGEFFLEKFGHVVNTELTPLTYQAAKNWAEKRLDADVYMKIFEIDLEKDEENEKVQVTLYLSKSCKNFLDQEQLKNGGTLGSIVENLLISYQKSLKNE